MANTTQTPATQGELEARWRAIGQAGGVASWIRNELDTAGLLVTRVDSTTLSKSRLKAYKKSLKAEAAAKRDLERQAWVAYKATHLVHLGEGIFWNDESDFDRWDLESAEARAAENELPPLDSPAALAEALEIDIPTLRRLTYHRDAAKVLNYTRFTIAKGDGTERPIWAPSPRLKRCQRWILANILERLPVHGSAHGFLPGRSIATNAAVHRDSDVLLKMDVQNFFPTVTFRRTKGVFRKAGYREQVATLLALLCTESPREVVEHSGETWYVSLGPRSLPQGAPTSPAITNVLSMRLDRRLAGLAKKADWRYSRYADDLTFSRAKGKKGDPKIGSLMGAIHAIVADEGFKVHPKKTRIARPGRRQKVTGLIVNGDGPPRVPREVKRQLRAAVHNLENGKPLRDGESVHTLIGYAAYIHMTEPELGRKYLERLAGHV